MHSSASLLIGITVEHFDTYGSRLKQSDYTTGSSASEPTTKAKNASHDLPCWREVVLHTIFEQQCVVAIEPCHVVDCGRHFSQFIYERMEDLLPDGLDVKFEFDATVVVVVLDGAVN